eukprot:gene8939-12054_t
MPEASSRGRRAARFHRAKLDFIDRRAALATPKTGVSPEPVLLIPGFTWISRRRRGGTALTPTAGSSSVSTHQQKKKKKPGTIIKSLSSSIPANPTNTQPTNQYEKQRSTYQKEMSELRKKWQAEYKLEQEKAEELKKLNRQKIVLEKAIRLREKRKETLIGQEKARKLTEQAAIRFQEKLARSRLNHQQRYDEQQAMYLKAVNALEKEAPFWINENNIDEKINAALFATPSTTGIVTRYSQHYKYFCRTTSLKKILEDARLDRPIQHNSFDAKNNLLGQVNFQKRMLAEEFLNGVIGSGSDRQKYKELLKEVMEIDKKSDLFGRFGEDVMMEHQSNGVVGGTGDYENNDYETGENVEVDENETAVNDDDDASQNDYNSNSIGSINPSAEEDVVYEIYPAQTSIEEAFRKKWGFDPTKK